MPSLRGTDARSARYVEQSAWIGACVQVVCLVLPLLDLWWFGSIDAHVRQAYPAWSESEIAADRTAIVAYLAAVQVLCLLGWVAMAAAARRDWHIRAVTTILFTAGAVIAIVNAGIGSGEYDQILPPWLGLTLLIVPVLPGLTAVVGAWSDGRRR